MESHDVSPLGLFAFIGPIIGLLVLLGGLYALRHHMLGGRKVGAVIAGIIAIIGALTLLAGMWAYI